MVQYFRIMHCDWPYLFLFFDLRVKLVDSIHLLRLVYRTFYDVC